MKISLQITASFRIPEIFSIFVIFKIFCFSLFKSVLKLEIIHLLSHTIIFSKSYNFKSLIIAVPAAPSPFTIIFTSSFFLQVTFKAFIIPAKQTIAVPC
jgi:hypothetical protein